MLIFLSYNTFFCCAGFNGTRCETDIDECANLRPCLNGATCLQDIPGKYSCNCPNGFTGVRCETDIDECNATQKTCANGGTCTDGVNPGTFNCICRPGFTGPTCEGEVDPCKQQPCRNGGQCSPSSPGSYNCLCPRGYRGK